MYINIEYILKTYPMIIYSVKIIYNRYIGLSIRDIKIDYYITS